MSSPIVLVWFRDDLRLADHAALSAACETAGETNGIVYPVYLHAPEDEADWPRGAAGRSYRHHSLDAFMASLEAEGSRLTIRTGDHAFDLLRALIQDTGATHLYFSRSYVPHQRERDEAICEALADEGITIRSFPGYLLHDPSEIRTTSGTPYLVYTPFWKRFRKEVDIASPLPVPDLSACTPDTYPKGATLDELGLLPDVDWDDSFYTVWEAGEDAAHDRLQDFLSAGLDTYADDRDRPDCDGTSRMSPRLHHGELSPGQIWHAVHAVTDGHPTGDAEVYLKELVWREFSYHVLIHHPDTPTEPLKDKFSDFSWQTDEDLLDAWQRGRTGYPIVDAGMRQLWETGWMHNRVRMIVASFLTKDLRIHWLEGARWFWDTLIDADLGNNTMGWQWSAGSGADAQPFFRVFNPISQGRKFDPQGAYVRRWVPELADLPTRHLHAPWAAPDEVLDEAGIRLGDTYPHPLVDHADAREAALGAYNRIK